jgi:thiamine-phosphate pyrophosphorylase
MTERPGLELPRLYAIVNGHPDGTRVRAQTEALIRAGVQLVQWRAKTLDARQAWEIGRELRALTRDAGVLFAVNDRADMAAMLEADLLHLGQDDLTPHMARKMFSGFIGLSTHNLEQVKAACAQEVDYIGFGPVYPTATKENPDPVTGIAGLRAAVAAATVPVVAIGGIALDRLPEIFSTGAAAVAVISALEGNPDEVEARARQFLVACVDVKVD